MTVPGEWCKEHEIAIAAEQIADFAAAIGEEGRAFGEGVVAPPMFAAVYAAPAVWQVVLATVEVAGPLIHAAQEFEWFAPVRAGDRIATRARLDDDTVRGAHRLLRFRSISHSGRRDLVSRGLWTILLPGAAA